MMAHDIDQEVNELCASVALLLRARADRLRRKYLRACANELELKPGTHLGRLALRLQECGPGSTERFEDLAGAQILLYALNSRAGYALLQVAIEEGKDEVEYIAGLVARAAQKFGSAKVQPKKAR